MEAGPDSPAAMPVSTKMPAPIIAPIPIIVASNSPRSRANVGSPVLGLSALVSPAGLPAPPPLLRFDLPVMIAVAVACLPIFASGAVIARWEGALFLFYYLAYTTYVVQLLMPEHIGASVLVAIPAAFVIAGLAGVVLERTIIRFLYGRPLETLLATFGVSLVLQQLVRSMFSANNRAVETPAWMRLPELIRNVT